MCLAVYLASDRALASVPWDEDRPAFHLQPVAASALVRKQFKLAHVYYAGSHEGCGCGFSKDGEAGEDLARCQQNYAALARVAREAMANGATLQVFTCWEGDQDVAPESVAVVDAAALEAPEFGLRELQLVDLAMP